MKITGSREIDLGKEKVWRSLRDVEVLEASIPGCESFERTDSEADTESYRSVIVTRIGPMKAKFSGNMTIEDADPPNYYKLVGSGSAGSAGAARGEVAIKLEAINPEKTKVDFDASVAMSGRIAQIGGKMINGTAEAFASEFFNNLSKNAAASIEDVTKASEFKISIPGVRKGRLILATAIIALMLLVYWLYFR